MPKDLKPILERIFYSQDPNESYRDPNRPENYPYFSQQRAIENKAFITWCQEAGGERLLGTMQQKLISQIVSLVLMEIKTVEDILKIIQAKRDIYRDVIFIDRIEQAFVEEEERQKKLQES